MIYWNSCKGNDELKQKQTQTKQKEEKLCQITQVLQNSGAKFPLLLQPFGRK